MRTPMQIHTLTHTLTHTCLYMKPDGFCNPNVFLLLGSRMVFMDGVSDDFSTVPSQGVCVRARACVCVCVCFESVLLGVDVTMEKEQHC